MYYFVPQCVIHMIYIAQKPEAEQACFSIIPSEKTGSTAGCKGSVCQAEANAKLKRKPGSGRRALMQPTEDHVRIIKLVRVHGVSKTALQIGRSRQRVHQVISRWAPELKKFKPNRMSEPVAKRVRLPRRNIVVSFRISSDEWRRLTKVDIDVGKGRTSVCKKARALVLNSLGPEGPHGGASH